MPRKAAIKKQKARGGYATFPLKLHKLLCEASENGYEDVISWLPDGKAFKVHDRTKFANEIMPTVFGSSKYRSFQKNLNMWSFSNDAKRKIVEDGVPARQQEDAPFTSTKGACCHPFFVREAPSLCYRMVRQSVVQSSTPRREKPAVVDDKEKRESSCDAAALPRGQHHSYLVSTSKNMDTVQPDGRKDTQQTSHFIGCQGNHYHHQQAPGGGIVVTLAGEHETSPPARGGTSDYQEDGPTRWSCTPGYNNNGRFPIASTILQRTTTPLQNNCTAPALLCRLSLLDVHEGILPSRSPFHIAGSVATPHSSSALPLELPSRHQHSSSREELQLLVSSLIHDQRRGQQQQSWQPQLSLNSRLLQEAAAAGRLISTRPRQNNNDMLSSTLANLDRLRTMIAMGTLPSPP